VSGSSLRKQILSGQSDSSIPFEPMCSLLRSLGLERKRQGIRNWFFYRYAGPHMLEVKEPEYGNMARPTDVRLVREFLRKYNLAG
jgi:hypothetical protein